MKKYIIGGMVVLLAFAASANDISISVNSIGFLPKAEKLATSKSACELFMIVNEVNGKMVYEGRNIRRVFHEDTNMELWILNFSDFTKKGKFYLKISDSVRSAPFKIGEDVYNESFRMACLGLYQWRCGTAVEIEYNGNVYKQDACHLDDAYEDYTGQEGKKRDGTGGWHDAGDYGKYVVNAGVSVAVLFNAWEHFNKKIKKTNLNIPESGGKLPDFLAELKWETDWLLKMQYPDGSGKVSHKLTRLNFAPFIMPGADSAKRYFSGWGTSATADFVAMMAMASRYFKPYDTEYAEKCLEAAILSYECLQNYPEYKRFEQGDFRTGGYQTGDVDDRLWAAAELWQTTGEKRYLLDFEGRINNYKRKNDFDWDWGNVKNLAVFTYILSKNPGRNESIVKEIKQDIIYVADSIVEVAKNDAYGRTLGNSYYWGCNGTVARQTVNLQIAHILTGNEKYRNVALDAIGHIFGRNYYTRSYVTGLGHYPPMNPHDRRSGADNVKEPWPGYIVGGGHTATDWVDVQASYSHNEIALNWQAALIYALAGFISK